MPTFIEYHAAAESCRALGRRLRDDATRSRSVADIVTGPVADALQERADELRRHLLDASHALGELAGLCDRRAEVCRAYAHALERWTQLGIVERAVTARPRPPAVWVEV